MTKELKELLKIVEIKELESYINEYEKALQGMGKDTPFKKIKQDYENLLKIFTTFKKIMEELKNG